MPIPIPCAKYFPSVSGCKELPATNPATNAATDLCHTHLPMLTFAVTVLTGAAAFSPPPVPTDTLPADAVPVTLTEPSRYGSWLEQAVVLISQEHEQEDV